MRKKMCMGFALSLMAWGALAQSPMLRQTRFEGQKITGVKAEANFKVEIYQSTKTSASIEIPAELQEKLLFNIDANGVVTLSINSSFLSKKNENLTAKVYLSDLKTLVVNSDATVKAMTPFKSTSTVITLASEGEVEDLVLHASGRVVIDAKSSGEIKGVITTPLLRGDFVSSAEGELFFNGAQCVVNLGSSASLTISGKAQEATFTATSAAELKGAELAIGKANLKSASAAKIVVGEVSAELIANASSAAGIRYKGAPKISNVKATSAGSVKRLD